jgi:hypothetical protein
LPPCTMASTAESSAPSVELAFAAHGNSAHAGAPADCPQKAKD